MSREVTATNQAEVDASHLHEVILVKLEFDTPLFFHSGIGSITFESNEYIGVGHYGAVDASRESELLTPGPVTLSLNGINNAILAGGLESGTYGDQVTMYLGYRQDDGTLVDDPWAFFLGWFETAEIDVGSTNSVSIVVQHDLSFLKEKDNGRISDEDQKQAYSADVAFEYIANMSTLKLFWGGGSVGPRPSIPPWKDQFQER